MTEAAPSAPKQHRPQDLSAEPAPGWPRPSRSEPPLCESAPRTVRAAWTEALRRRGFALELVLSLAAVAVGISVFSQFLAWVELRPGALLADPVLALYESRDVGDATFAVIYGAILLALFALRLHPRLLVAALQSYLLLIGMRALLMWVTPLEAPEHLIVLRDPIVNNAVPGPPLQRDLFFSGHTSTLVLLSLWMPGARWRGLVLTAAVICAALLLVQHAHYTVDVLVAPLASWAAYSIVRRARRSSRTIRE